MTGGITQNVPNEFSTPMTTYVHCTVCRLAVKTFIKMNNAGPGQPMMDGTGYLNGI